jgi:galactose oxidase
MRVTKPDDTGHGSESPRRSVGNTIAGVVTPEMRQGHWGPVLTFPNAAIHTHVLPDGRLLMWGRRARPTPDFNQHECTPFLWDPTDPTEPADPTTAKTVSTPQPTLADGTKVNLFCSGHAFLPDGRLLVAGGHLQDTEGVNQASIYDFAGGSGPGTWQATALMNHGRWYPTATTLPDGSVLVLSGSFWITPDNKNAVNNVTPQVWSDGAWTSLSDFPDEKTLDLYPRLHVISDGRVFMSGPQQDTWLLDTANGGRWEKTTASHTTVGQLDYAPAVMYDFDKIIYIGGGGGADVPPANEAEIIDLQKKPLAWQPTASMNFRRRQHNGTLLPDGTVLVTGGTRAAGPFPKGFNNLDPDQPVHVAELWDPATGTWTELAAELVDRCYHSTAVLLPDATVLSAGGGEFPGQNPGDTHRDGQIFRPPYLFKGDRPEITSAPTAPIHYGDTFDVESPQADAIAKVSWLRLTSVTHAFNASQRINFLDFSVHAGTLSLTAPHSPNVCPPGFYMLFLLNRDGVPSVARIVQIQAPQEVMAAFAAARRASATVSEPTHDDFESRRSAAAEKAGGPAVVVGLTSTCPYGLSACWGGANEALNRLEGVDWVNPIADAEDSTAEVFLAHPGLPPLNRWVDQFHAIVNGRYEWRGVEMTLTGVVEGRDGSLSLAGSENGPAVRLARLTAAERIQFDTSAPVLQPLQAGEARAYDNLAAAVKTMPAGQHVTVTGPLDETSSGYVLHVRLFGN